MVSKKKQRTASPIGRPNKFTVGLGQEICSRMAEGRSLKSICEDEDMPSQSMVFRWLADETRSDFREKYRAFMTFRADALHEIMLNTATTPLLGEIKATKETKDGTFDEVKISDNVERSKLIVNTIQWQLARMEPKKYGDKVQYSGDQDNPINHKITVGSELADILTLEQLEEVKERVLAKSNPS